MFPTPSITIMFVALVSTLVRLYLAGIQCAAEVRSQECTLFVT